MNPRIRKLAITAHITFSVGWLGAVAVFLALAVAGLTSQDSQTVRAAYLAMELTAWFVIVPLAFASLLTGLVQALGTEWGLLRHYWVVAKFLLTIFATIVLLLKMELISYIAGVAAKTTLSSADLREARMSLVAHACGGLLVLLGITTLSVFKPFGKTRYGRRSSGKVVKTAGLMSLSPVPMVKHSESAQLPGKTITTTDGLPLGLKIFLAIIGVIVAGFVVLHLAGGGLGMHRH